MLQYRLFWFIFILIRRRNHWYILSNVCRKNTEKSTRSIGKIQLRLQLYMLQRRMAYTWSAREKISWATHWYVSGNVFWQKRQRGIKEANEKNLNRRSLSRQNYTRTGNRPQKAVYDVQTTFGWNQQTCEITTLLNNNCRKQTLSCITSNLRVEFKCSS